MRHLDLFAGIGGFSLAAHWMGWTTVAQVEWDEWCQKVLAKNFPDALRFGDIVEFNKMLENGEITTHSGCTAKQVTNKGTMGCEDAETERERGIRVLNPITHPSLRDGQIHIGHIDIITGGFPCQPFSHAGKRKGTDDSRYLWPAMLETIRRVKPSYVVGENVAGLVSMENGKTLDRILSDLEDEGYTTAQVIIPACAVGAWHRRDRIWIIAHNANAGIKNLHRRENTICRCENVPHSRLLGSEIDEQQTAGFVECGEDAAYGDNQGLQGWKNGRGVGSIGTKRDQQPERCGECNGGAYWLSEPSVGRVANGIPNRVDRLKGLGNAIVPQVVYQIFKAIESHNIRELYDSSRD